MASNSAWKGFERRIAKLLNGRRIPVTGVDRAGADVVTNTFDVQCKLRKGQPSYLREWLDGICGTAARRGQIGIVVWKHTGSQHVDNDALVILRLGDFVDYTTGRTHANILKLNNFVDYKTGRTHAKVSGDSRSGLDV